MLNPRLKGASETGLTKLLTIDLYSEYKSMLLTLDKSRNRNYRSLMRMEF